MLHKSFTLLSLLSATVFASNHEHHHGDSDSDSNSTTTSTDISFNHWNVSGCGGNSSISSNRTTIESSELGADLTKDSYSTTLTSVASTLVTSTITAHHSDTTSVSNLDDASSSDDASASASNSFTASASSSSSSYAGRGTYWTPDSTDACGITAGPNDLVAAIGINLYDSNTNSNYISGYCGKKININYQGKSVSVTVVDACATCGDQDLDLSPSAFAALADLSIGEIQLSWSWA
ncbi:hypothetical protein DASC09_042520 [Saccharomycopsis crataegensis]|uniref:RlpA-like protein double-psi beta-barrel domain-containing protein n=1 Tax=Saccharomycopsis crataegensis TaxID=43959 RepID=A0AAV5QPZ3_9ASCO|nr:hypothetical protein DASC09_042520 [Saccharomycopsis crataegensis]